VFVLRADLIPAQARALLLSTARAVLVGRRGILSEQLDHLREEENCARAAAQAHAPRARSAAARRRRRTWSSSTGSVDSPPAGGNT
jgi:cyclic beta-1,2-glucan synthetase